MSSLSRVSVALVVLTAFVMIPALFFPRRLHRESVEAKTPAAEAEPEVAGD